MTELPGDGSLDQGQTAGGRAESNAEDEGGTASSAAQQSGGEVPKTPNLPPHLANMVKVTQKTAKTMLDHSVLKEVVAKTAAKEEEKVAEQIKAKANEPVKPFEPIENYKIATPCASMWEGTDPKERYRYCEKCHLQVYDFTGMELPEAEALIFKRESRKNAPLFKRADGKFLTADCPVGVGSKRNLILSIVGGTLLVICVLAFLMMMPHPKPAVTTEQAPSSETGKSSTSASVDSSKSLPLPASPADSRSPDSAAVSGFDQPASGDSYTSAPIINAPKAPDEQTPEWTEPAITPTPAPATPAASPAQPAAAPVQPAAEPASPADQSVSTDDSAPAEPAAPAPASSGVNYYPPSSAPSSR